MRLRFTIRDLLWLAVVVALTVGWLLHSITLTKEVQRLQANPSQTEYAVRLSSANQEIQELRALLKASNRTIEELRATHPAAP